MRKFFLNIFILSVFTSCQLKNESTKENTDSTALDNSKHNTDTSEFSYLPTSTTNTVYKHKGYTFSYSEAHEQSEWVAYELEDGKWKYSELERPLFEQDPMVETESAHWGNYKKSGYTKGHLCPAGDRKQSQELYDETFFTSNASPQLYDFNAGVWNRLENKVRYWAGKYDGIYVCGPHIMMEKVSAIAKEYNIPCQVSLEKHMACGIGACLSCTCQSKDGSRKKVCSDGPVFYAEEVF